MIRTLFYLYIIACTLLLLAAAAHAAPVMVVDSGTTQYLDGWQLDANGWLDTSVLTVGDVYYVSSSIGNDSYDGTSGTVDGGGVGPKATIAAGLALMTNGDPDWLLLKRGDVWSEALTTSLTGGSSKTAPMLFGAYGTGNRPVVIEIKNTGVGTQYTVVQDIHTVAAGSWGDADAFFENIWFGGTETLVEDPYSGMFYPGSDGSVVSRCLFDDHYYNGGGSKTGMYFGADGLVLVDSYFYGNRDRDTREDEASQGNPHALYSQTSATDVTIDNCVLFMMRLGGVTTRGSGTITDCLSFRGGGSIGGIGHLYEWETYTPNGVTGLSARNINIQNAMFFTNTAASGLTVEDNILIGPLSEYGMEIGSECRGGTFSDNIVYNGQWNISSGTALAMDNNILWRDGYPTANAWAMCLEQDTGTTATWANTVFYDPSGSSNYIRYHGTAYNDISAWEAVSGATGSTYGAPSFVAPSRGLESYLEGLGYGPYADEQAAWDAFVAIMRAQDRTTWDSRFEAEAINAHIRAGFEVSE